MHGPGGTRVAEHGDHVVGFALAHGGTEDRRHGAGALARVEVRLVEHVEYILVTAMMPVTMAGPHFLRILQILCFRRLPLPFMTVRRSLRQAGSRVQLDDERAAQRKEQDPGVLSNGVVHVVRFLRRRPAIQDTVRGRADDEDHAVRARAERQDGVHPQCGHGLRDHTPRAIDRGQGSRQRP